MYKKINVTLKNFLLFDIEKEIIEKIIKNLLDHFG